MKILVIGGTRFFGIPMVQELLRCGHEVTIATRGQSEDHFGNSVSRITLERTNAASMKAALKDKYYDVVIDKVAYCSNDVRNALEAVSCRKYIQMSSTAVYDPKHWDTIETDYDGFKHKLVWCERSEFSYDEVKRQAENALCQKYNEQNWVAVRYPVVLGKNDYTKRLLFYIEHTMQSNPMYIDNLDAQMGYIEENEAGKMMAFLVDKDYSGPINGCSAGTISIRQIIEHVEKKTGTKAVLDLSGDEAPYNGETEFSIHTKRAEQLGFSFSNLQDWIFDLLNYYIACVQR